MPITKREFLKGLGALGMTGAAASAVGDEFVSGSRGLPPGSCGDPDNPWFAKHIFPLERTMADGPSCRLENGQVIEPAHTLPVFHRTDVVVVGGGPAGFSAAVAAARTGAKVALVERYGSLGGLFTNGMVLLILSTSRRANDGTWSLVTRGVCEEFMKRVGTYGTDFSSFPSSTCPKRHWQPTVDPECAKVTMDAMIAEAGVEMFFHSWGVDVIQDGSRVAGVVFESKQGRQAILARQVVDCTGDADMLFRAGGSYRQITHSISLCSRWGNMDTIRPPKGVTPKYQLHGNEGNPDANWGGSPMLTGNGLSVRDLSRAEVVHRRSNWEKVLEMRRTPGWEKVYTTNTASQIGPRATRLIDAELVVGRKEIAAGLSAEETVGWCGHDGPHAAFPIPYRQLVPKGVDNLLCAGRCLGQGDTIDTFRLIAPCFVTGEAAGTAAALSAKTGCTPRELDVKVLRKILLGHGVFLAGRV